MLQRAQSPWLVVAKRRSRLAGCGELQFPISYDFLRSKVTGVVAVGNAESQFFREEAQGARHRAKDRNRRRCCQLSLVRGPLREKHGA